MEIINTTFENGVITITLDSAATISKVYLDNISNYDNIYSDDDNKHTYVITNATTSGSSVIVDVSEYDATSFIVSVISSDDRAETIAIDLDNLYQAKVNALTSYCNTCLDKHLKEIIIMCDFKSQLLDYALNNNLLQDAIQHYIDLSRLLNIPDKHCCARCKRCVKVCKTCCNGVCSL